MVAVAQRGPVRSGVLSAIDCASVAKGAAGGALVEATVLQVAINSENAGLRLSVQRALLGAVSPNLYGACADLRDDAVVLTWYVAAGMPPDEREDLQVAATEVIADYPEGYHVDERFVEVADPSTPLTTMGAWTFLRRGFRTIDT